MNEITEAQFKSMLKEIRLLKNEIAEHRKLIAIISIRGILPRKAAEIMLNKYSCHDREDDDNDKDWIAELNNGN